MKKVLVTGALGCIGRVVCQALQNEFTIDPIDIRDVKNPINLADPHRAVDVLSARAKGADVLIHLAWNARGENWRNARSVPENKSMVEAAYEAAKQAGVKRVIMASSIHADSRFYDWASPRTFLPDMANAIPDSPYGATKLWAEALGRHYASKHGLEVVCIRFGGVALDNVPRQEPLAEKIWLHTEDCASLVKTCVDIPEISRKFRIVNGVSDNAGRPHCTNNPFGWRPKHNFVK